MLVRNQSGEPIMILDGPLPPAYPARSAPPETADAVREDRTANLTAVELLIPVLRRDIRALRTALEARATDSHAFRHDRTVRLRRCPEPSCVQTVALLDQTGGHDAH